MSTLTLKDATEAIYTSLKNDNEDIDLHIASLKSVLKSEGKSEAVFEPARLVQNNREGRKMMQAYFKKRGVKVSFCA
jgi:hypothetical protein